MILAKQAAEYEAARLLHQPVVRISLRRLLIVEASGDCRPDMAGPGFSGCGMGHSRVPP